MFTFINAIRQRDSALGKILILDYNDIVTFHSPFFLVATAFHRYYFAFCMFRAV